ncbi:MAG TPA: WD40 repeat domain-containing protein, partial [Gemmataceae bacterium]|nr:WD40 repeat domain-containing protein [Gemmataceae bacterium]
DPDPPLEKPGNGNRPDNPPPINKKPLPAKPPELDPVDSVWVDLLPLIDPDLHSVAGQWHLDKSGALISDENTLSRLQVPYAPGYEYILKVTVEPVSGTPLFYVGLALPGKHVDVAFSQSLLLTGLDLVANNGFAKNETARKGAPFLPDQPNEIICTVSAGSIKVEVEGRTLLDWKGGFSRITSNLNLWLPNNKALSLTSQRAGVRISKMSIKTLVGKGTILAGGPADGADISLRKKMLPGLGRLAGTEWINSNNDIVEWNWEGKCFYNGLVRAVTGIDEKTIKISNDDTLTFDDRLQTFVQSKAGGKNFTGKRLETGDWFELRISAGLSGKYRLLITPTSLRWETLAGTSPTFITMNRNPWTVSKEPVASHADFASLFGKSVDLTRVRLEKTKGTASIGLEKGKNALSIIMDGAPKDAAKKQEPFEFTLHLRAGKAKPNPFKLISQFHSNNVPVDLAVSADGRMAAIADKDGMVRLWELETAKRIWEAGTHVGKPNSLCFLDKSNLVAFIGSDGALRFVESGPNDKVGRMDLQDRSIQSLFPVADKQQLLFSTDAFRIGTVDVQGGNGSDLLTFRMEQKRSASALAFSANGKRALTSGEDSVTRIWDLSAKTELGRLPVKNMCECGALSADGSFAATFGRLGHSIQIWDVKTGRLLRGTAPLNGVPDPRYMAFSPDAKRLISVNADGKVHVWNTADCKEIGNFGKNPAAIKSARFMPDGRSIIVAEVEGIIRVWRLPE